MHNGETILDEALVMARVSARRRGLQVVQDVMHTQEDVGYVLKEIRGEMAIIWKWQTETEKRVPLRELADAKRVVDLVYQLARVKHINPDELDIFHR